MICGGKASVARGDAGFARGRARLVVFTNKKEKENMAAKIVINNAKAEIALITAKAHLLPATASDAIRHMTAQTAVMTSMKRMEKRGINMIAPLLGSCVSLRACKRTTS